MELVLAGAGIVIVGAVVAWVRMRGSRNSGAGRARDVGRANPANPDAYGAHTTHQGNLPF